MQEAHYLNIRVIDDQGAAVRYYVMNDFHVFNQTTGEGAQQPEGDTGAASEETSNS